MFNPVDGQLGVALPWVGQNSTPTDDDIIIN
jgi:hypothetical protein